ncbi:ankyrin repeat-containing domain protein [Coniochaeta sp. 2T2.1]|nr:ankyrin repeat-containing domain protein [Coniochaeta sp. 2T2.1]
MMHVAATGDSTGCIQVLAAKGEPVSPRDLDGLEPLHCAAMTGTPASVAWLLEHGADIEATTLESWGNKTPLMAASSTGNTGCGAFLIRRGAKVLKLDTRGHTVMGLVIEGKHISFVKMLIQEHPGQFETWMTDVSRGSPIHWAALAGSVDILRVLLDAAPPSWRIEALSNQDTTPLYEAVSKNKQDCAELLLKHGASVLTKCRGRTVIHRAARHDQVDLLRVMVQALPRNHTVDILADDGDTPLRHAAAWGKPESVRFLIEQGASALKKNDKVLTPIHAAAEQGCTECLQLLISALPAHESGLDIPGGELSATPLMYAAMAGKVDCAELLLANGASGQTRDAKDWTAAHHAAFSGSVGEMRLSSTRRGPHMTPRTRLQSQAPTFPLSRHFSTRDSL